jgi:hypothetical protein
MWLYFVLAIGSPMTAGIYLGKIAAGAGGGTMDVARVVIFGLLGTFWALMYGNARKERGSQA